ncbi:MAG: hypothetical protein ACRCUQ_03825 [Alphaproteobacteria bacterium]
MFRKFFIFCASLCLIFIFGGPAYSIELSWPTESSFYVSFNALKRFRFDENKTVIRNVKLSKYPKLETFIRSQATPEGRKFFFDERMEFSMSSTYSAKGFGQPLTVLATKSIEKGSFLGVFLGTVRYLSETGSSPEDLLAEDKENFITKMGRHDIDFKDLWLYYEEHQNQSMLKNLQYMSCVRLKKSKFVVSACKALGPMNFINFAKSEDQGDANVYLEWLFIQDVQAPLCVVRALKNLNPGEELLRRTKRLPLFEDISSRVEKLRKSIDEVAEENRPSTESLKNTCEYINKIAKDLGVDKQIQIFPTEQDREVIDVLSLLRESKT